MKTIGFVRFFVMINIGMMALSSPVFAQSFDELNSVDSTAVSEEPGPSHAPADQAAGVQPLQGQDLPPSASVDPMADPQMNEEFRKVMKPKEYQQFIAAKTYSEKNSTYTLGPNDVIDITVLRHPEVSGKYIINSEGKIQYEFIGDVLLSGYTKDEAAQVLGKILGTYIVNPQVTIKISEYNSKIVFVVGEVGKPGKIIMRGDTITVREALLEAGLPLLTAKTTHASMFTPTVGDVKRRIVNVDALLYKGDLRENFIMKPGDTLYIPATFWAKAMRVINPIAQPIGQAAGTTATVTTGI